MNGAGKTSLIKLLLRLYELNKGHIYINGIDITQIPKNEYYQLFSVIFQDFNLFEFPIDENVAGGIEFDRETMIESLKGANILERVLLLDEMEKTVIECENGVGVNFSGGERQKLATARAIYKDAQIIIMDEPTAALDPVAEMEAFENYRKLSSDKLAIFISHRMSSCKFCDRIIVLDKGKIESEGTHEDLMSQDGLYRKMFHLQSKFFEES